MIRLFVILFLSIPAQAAIFKISIENSRQRFTPQGIKISLGDTIQWTVPDMPTTSKTVISTKIPSNANSFGFTYDTISDLVFQYVPTEIGDYEYISSSSSETMKGYFKVVKSTRLIKIGVWDSYQSFNPFYIKAFIGDTIIWAPYLGVKPLGPHTITSTKIPVGAKSFDYLYGPPSDTLFMYVIEVAGTYQYQCDYHSHHMKGTIDVSDPLGNTDSKYEKVEISLYPNPFNDYINIRLEPDFSNVIEIHNIYGQIILHYEVNNENSLRLNTASLIPGIYLINIINNRSRKSFKVIHE